MFVASIWSMTSPKSVLKSFSPRLYRQGELIATSRPRVSDCVNGLYLLNRRIECRSSVVIIKRMPE